MLGFGALTLATLPRAVHHLKVAVEEDLVAHEDGSLTEVTTPLDQEMMDSLHEGRHMMAVTDLIEAIEATDLIGIAGIGEAMHSQEVEAGEDSIAGTVKDLPVLPGRN